MAHKGMKFGIFLAPFHKVGENPTLAMNRDMELIEWMDYLGYDEVWIGEHHSAGWELIASPEVRAVIERSPDDTDPITLTRRYLADADLVIVEGFQREALPKVEVFRRAVAATPIYDASLPNFGEWLAIVTDDAQISAECPVLRFKDTIWLQLVSSLAWDGALKL